jgi:valyl-tRNA synthetase
MVFIGEAVDTKVLADKFRKNLERDKKFIAALEGKLANQDFLKNAPPELVEGERQKLKQAKDRTGKIEGYIKNMEAGC